MAIDVLSPKHNLAGVAVPGSGDDRDAGYTEGSRWINTLTSTEYVCRDATVGRAMWQVNPYSGIANVAGLSQALGDVQDTLTRFTITEPFTKRPFLAADVTIFTDSTGGVLTTPNTLADQNDAVTGVDGIGSNAASKADVDARLVTIANNVGKAALKINNMLVANPNFEVAGTNMTSALVTIDGTRGGVRLTTAGAASDQAICQPRLTNANDSRWAKGFNTSKSPRVVFQFQCAAVTALKIKIALALTNALNLTTDDDQIGIFFDAATDTFFSAITSIGGTDVASLTAITPTLATEYQVIFDIDASRVGRVYVNGALVYTSGVLAANKNLLPFLEIESSSGAKSIDVRPITAGASLA